MVISNIFNIKLLVSVIVLLLLDSIYLTSLSGHFKQQILDVQKSPMNFRWGPTIVCYIALVFGINYFILQKESKVLDAILLGLVIYTVFETTNMALFDNWNLKSVLIDSVWGGILFGLTTLIVNKVTN
jgi:uncharacterized membrane protein